MSGVFPRIGTVVQGAVPDMQLLSSKEGQAAVSFLKDYFTTYCGDVVVISQGPMGHFHFDDRKPRLLNLHTGDEFSWRLADEEKIIKSDFSDIDVEALCLTLGLKKRAADPVEAFLRGRLNVLTVSTVDQLTRLDRVLACSPRLANFRYVVVDPELSNSFRKNRI